jgi:branched-chain amino acid transport system substrate-binding protein
VKLEAKIDRRKFLAQVGAVAAGAFLRAPMAFAQPQKLRLGLMLPYSGDYAQLGTAITHGFKLAVNQRGGKLGGRELEYFAVDDRGEAARAAENVDTLVRRHEVDVLIGTVDDDVQMTMVKIARETRTLLIIPSSGMDAAAGALCAPNIFRTSASHWQSSFPMGKVLADRGIRTVASVAWKHGSGEEAVAAFTEGFVRAGGKLVRGFWPSIPSTEFDGVLAEIASIKPEAVFAYLTGSGAIKFVKKYAANGLAKTIPLFGAGFLTEGVLHAIDGAAEGIETTLHYADDLDNKRNQEFRDAYAKAYRQDANVYAVQGYDAALLLARGLDAVKGDVRRQKELIAAMSKGRIDSPRGAWRMSKAHNPIQDIYLRKAVGRDNRFVGVARKALADPARGCKM